MRTITLELPDELVAQLEAMPADERTQTIATALNRKPKTDAEPPFSQEDIDAIREGIADVRAGRVVPLADVIAQMKEVARNGKRA